MQLAPNFRQRFAPNRLAKRCIAATAGALLTAVFVVAFPTGARADVFSYSYGHPATPLNDGYIINTSNAILYSEGTVRTWIPNVGSGTFGSTTPGVVEFLFDFGQPTSDIDLWMNMPTFHWSYSRGHNFLFGSNDGSNWTQLAELTPPAFGSARDLGTVNVPQSLIGPSQLFLRVELYSFGSSAWRGPPFTNTAQLSRYDVNANNTSFSLTASLVPEPASTLVFGIPGLIGLAFYRRRKSIC